MKFFETRGNFYLLYLSSWIAFHSMFCMLIGQLYLLLMHLPGHLCKLSCSAVPLISLKCICICIRICISTCSSCMWLDICASFPAQPSHQSHQFHSSFWNVYAEGGSWLKLTFAWCKICVSQKIEISLILWTKMMIHVLNVHCMTETLSIPLNRICILFYWYFLLAASVYKHRYTKQLKISSE